MELADRAAIVDVATGYATAVDSRDWVALAGLFTEDAHWVYPPTGEDLTGPAAIASYIRKSIERLDASQHLLGNHVVTIDGDEARHTCYFHAQHVLLGLPDGETYFSGGRYEDQLRRTPEGWRLTYRTVVSVWREGNVAVVRG